MLTRKNILMRFVIISSAVVALTSGIMWPNWVNEIRAYYGKAGKCELPDFDISNFGSSMDNPYLAISNLGYTYVYEAETDEGLVRNYIWFKPSLEETKVVMGVTCNVIFDVEYVWVEELSPPQWKMLKETDDWHAWDKYGNFWYFGEETTELIYDDEWNKIETSTEGSWEAGVDDAKPGIILLADPQPGDCVQQEFYKDEAEDRGKVLKLNGDKSEYCEKNCLVTKEWTPLDRGNVEHKYYAPDLGLVYIKELKGKTVIYERVDYFSGSPPLVPTPLMIAPIQ